MSSRALSVLEENHLDGYTVPAQGLYPYQWCWDSGPIALGWAAAGQWDRGWGELQKLLSAQWSSGMVPHIVFWAPSHDYFPGPDVWGTDRTPPTTGLTQPPLPVSAATRLYVADPDRDRARQVMRDLWPGLVRWLTWVHRARRGPHGAAVVVHPWESGMDNSPAWDEALAAVPEADHRDLDRRDLATVAAHQRPTNREYRHYLGIVLALRTAGWDTERQIDDSPFAVEDPGFTAIAARAAIDLLAVAPELGEDPGELGTVVADLHAGLAALWDDERGWFRARNVKTRRRLGPATVAGLLALYADAATDAQVARMVERLDQWREAAPISVPSCDPHAVAFDAERYWRGPVWVLTNWLVADGLARAGHADRSEHLRATTHTLVEGAGFTEYYDPRSGAGIGGQGFSWSAALTLAWVAGSL